MNKNSPLPTLARTQANAYRNKANSTEI